MCNCFRANFKDLFDDDEEMNEAVFYLNLQGTYVGIMATHREVSQQTYLGGRER